MRISGLIKNDVVNGIGVCVSLFTQGCPHHCKGCFNPETWDYNGGIEYDNLKEDIIKAISANNIIRNFSILGGEPLCPENRKNVNQIILDVRKVYPNIKIFVWTGYTIEYLKFTKDQDIQSILNNIDILIDGPFCIDLKDTSLPLRGSSNQRIITLKKEGEIIKCLNYL